MHAYRTFPKINFRVKIGIYITIYRFNFLIYSVNNNYYREIQDYTLKDKVISQYRMCNMILQANFILEIRYIVIGLNMF